MDQLCGYLRDKACLLILDNYEHLLGGADLVSQLLTAAPRFKIIATSRQPLQQPEEWLLPVEGLSVPTSCSDADLMRQFVTTKLETNNEINANAPRERHSHYYLDWASRQALA